MNGYDKIEKELKLDQVQYRTDILVTIKCGNTYITVLLQYEIEHNDWVWDFDWWEGEEDVEFIGAAYLNDQCIVGNKLEYKEEE